MMKNKIFAFFLFFILNLLSAQFLLCSDEEPELLNSKKLMLTNVTALLEVPVAKGKSNIFCAGFNMAWDILAEDVFDQPFKVEGDPEMIQLLNNKAISKRDIPDKDYFVIAGLKEEGIERRLLKGERDKFGNDMPVDIRLDNHNDIVVYAHFIKEPKFTYEFESLEEPVMFNGFSAVSAFGILNYDYGEASQNVGKQVSVFDYQDDKDFIILLKTNIENEQLILAKTAPQKTLLETVNNVLSRVKKNQPSDLVKGDTLQIPKIDFNLSHNFEELSGKYISNVVLRNPLIAKALMIVRFKFNQEGGMQNSDLGVGTLGMSTTVKQKKLIFDKPFLVMLKLRDAKLPYFAMWAGNSELFSKE
ncbi:MAG: hypothetical protein ABIG46_07175 [Candidatus Omnitrophota bacterium]